MNINYRKIEGPEAREFRRVRLACLREFPDQFGSLYADEAAKPKLYFEQLIELDLADIFFFGAFVDDRELVAIAGFVRGDRSKTRHRGEIVAVYVDPRYHGRKVGERLLRAIIEAAFRLDGVEQVHLALVDGNAAAERLYRRIGFETYGVQRNYLKDGDRRWDQKFMQLMREDYVSAE